MQVLANAYKQMISLKGTTNPSGTAAALTRIANKASHNILAMLGGIHGGFLGAAVGHGVERAARAIGDSRNGRAAINSFYGPQPKSPGATREVDLFFRRASCRPDQIGANNSGGYSRCCFSMASMANAATNITAISSAHS